MKYFITVIKLFMLSSCMIISFCAEAQSYSFVRFTIDNGLSNNVVYSTHQDKKGYLWIATHDGLNRYDGYNFKKFLHFPFDKTTLASSMAIDVVEDGEGRIWVLTNTHLHCYRGIDESFERFPLPAGTINHSNQSASKILDGSPQYLLLNLFNGLFVFDKNKKQFRSLTAESGDREFPDLFNYPFFKDKEGNCLISAGSSNGLLVFDAASISLNRKLPHFYKEINFPKGIVTSIHRNRLNKFVYCLQEGNRFFLVSEKGRKHFLTNRTITGSTVFLESIQEDDKGDLWIGTGNQLYKYFPEKDSIIEISHNLYNTSAGNNFIIKTLCIDSFNNLWVGLYEAGLLKASTNNSLFNNFSINQTGNLKLPHSSIYGLIKNPDETIIVRYFGTPMASLLDVEGKKVITKEFKFNLTDSTSIRKIFPRFEKVESSMPFYKYFTATSRITFNNGQFGLYKDGEGNYWSVNFNELTRLSDNKIFKLDHHINCFYEGKQNTFWIGTDGGGLLELNYKTGKINRFFPEELNPRSLSSNFVNGIVSNGEKGLWLATRFGLNYFDFQSRSFHLFSEEQGLCNNTIYSIEKDRRGNLWLGTSNGLGFYDPGQNEFISYSKNNGLVNSEYNRNGTLSLNNGWIVMGGTEGIDIIKPDSIEHIRLTNLKHANLVIHSFSTQDSVYYSPAKTIELPYLQNNVAISFALLDFTQPSKNKYQWKLEPIDSSWHYALGKSEVNYGGLRPGNYTFKVKAAGSDGVWVDKETTLNFTINESWWQSNWVIGTAILLGMGMIGILLRIYYHRKFSRQLNKQKLVLEKQRLIEKERTRIAADMHDDLGAGLSRIKFLSETIGIKRFQELPIEEDISKIKEYSSQMINKMGEIVWALNEKNDLLSELLSYTRSYAMEYLEQENIACTVVVPEELPNLFVSGEFRRNIFLSVKEILHNVVKHAGAQKVNIDITLYGHLQITISDNGIGLDESNVRVGGYGLTNIKKRMEELHGTMKFSSNQSGTTFILTVKLPQ